MPDTAAHCTIAGCTNVAAPGEKVCTSADCFGFHIRDNDGTLRYTTSNVVYERFGYLPTGDIVCNDDEGFRKDYGDEITEEVLTWLRTQT